MFDHTWAYINTIPPPSTHTHIHTHTHIRRPNHTESQILIHPIHGKPHKTPILATNLNQLIAHCANVMRKTHGHMAYSLYVTTSTHHGSSLVHATTQNVPSTPNSNHTSCIAKEQPSNKHAHYFQHPNYSVHVHVHTRLIHHLSHRVETKQIQPVKKCHLSTRVDSPFTQGHHHWGLMRHTHKRPQRTEKLD